MSTLKESNRDLREKKKIIKKGVKVILHDVPWLKR